MATFKLGRRELHKSNSDHCLDLAERGIHSANFRKLRDTRNKFRASIASTYSQLLSPSCSHSANFFLMTLLAENEFASFFPPNFCRSQFAVLD
jgi:hypothetical protein